MLPYESGNIKITSPYGNRVDPITGEQSYHSGIDLVGQGPKTVVAAEGGRVGASQMLTDGSATSQWGNYVRIDTDSGAQLYYCHLSQRLVSVGQVVRAGDHIGIEGSTGRSTGSHLHFEVRRGGAKLNAADYLGIPNACGVVGQPDYASEVCSACGLGDAFRRHLDAFPYAAAAWRKIWEALHA